MSEEHNLIPFIEHQLMRLAGNADYNMMFQALTIARETIIKAAPNDQWLGSVIPHDLSVSELRAKLANTERKLRQMIDAEHQLSDAYIRIRELVGTISMTGPVWANTEEAVKKLVEKAAGNELTERQMMAAGVTLFAHEQLKVAHNEENSERADWAYMLKTISGNSLAFADNLRMGITVIPDHYRKTDTSVHGASPNCDHHWIASEGRTSSGVLCNKCGAYDVPDPEKPHARFPQFTNREFAGLQAEGCAPNDQPCVICGVTSSHPEGHHYCKAKADK